MENNQLQLATYSQAQRLKAAGFDWPTDHFIIEADESRPRQIFTAGQSSRFHFAESVRPLDWNNLKALDGTEDFGSVSVPTVALALKWMRDVKGYAMAIGDCHLAGNVFDAEYMYSFTPYRGHRTNVNHPTHPTYESAESALLDELLNLIEKQS